MNFTKILFLMIFLSSSFSLASLAGFIENSQKPIKIKKLEEKAKVVIANKNYAQTINLYTQIINLNPPDLINFLFKRANIYKLQKDYINCLKDYNNILQIDPYNFVAYFERGILYLNNLDNNKKALEDFNRCSDLSKNKKLFSEKLHSELMAFKGIAKLNLSLNEEGFKDCKEAEKNIPENVNVISCFCIYYNNTGKYNEAIVYADKVVKLSPDKKSYYSQGVILKELKHYEEALKSFDKSIELGNESSDVFSLKGRIYKEQKNYKASLEELNKAILHSKKDDYTLYSFRGSTKWDLHDLEGSLIDFNTTLKINPKYHVAHSNKCELLEILNNLEEALQSCNEAIKLKPDYPNSYQYKARIHKRQNHYDLALQDALKAKELYEKHLPIQKDSDYYLLESFIKSVSK